MMAADKLKTSQLFKTKYSYDIFTRDAFIRYLRSNMVLSNTLIQKARYFESKNNESAENRNTEIYNIFEGIT